MEIRENVGDYTSSLKQLLVDRLDSWNVPEALSAKKCHKYVTVTFDMESDET